MAGGHIFLEPILQNTVVAPINSINAAIEPLPGKIEEQIKALTEVSALIGASTTAINIIAGDQKTQNIQPLLGFLNVGFDTYGTPKTSVHFWAHATTNGRAKAKFPKFTMSTYAILTGQTCSFGYQVKDITANTTVMDSGTIQTWGTNQTKEVAEYEKDFPVVAGHEYALIWNFVRNNNIGRNVPTFEEDATAVIEYSFNNPMIDGAFTL